MRNTCTDSKGIINNLIKSVSHPHHATQKQRNVLSEVYIYPIIVYYVILGDDRTTNVGFKKLQCKGSKGKQSKVQIGKVNNEYNKATLQGKHGRESTHLFQKKDKIIINGCG